MLVLDQWYLFLDIKTVTLSLDELFLPKIWYLFQKSHKEKNSLKNVAKCDPRKKWCENFRLFFRTIMMENKDISIKDPSGPRGALKKLSKCLGDLWNGAGVYWYDHGMWPIILEFHLGPPWSKRVFFVSFMSIFIYNYCMWPIISVCFFLY